MQVNKGKLYTDKQYIELLKESFTNLLKDEADLQLRINKAIDHIDLYIRRIHKGNYYVTPIELEYLKEILKGEE